MNPTTRYLIRETALRWRTRPSSPLARVVLTFTLTATAGGFLAGFAASAEALRVQLSRLGFGTVVVRSLTTDNPAPQTGRLPADHWAAPLEAEGDLFVVRQSTAAARTHWGQPVFVFTAPWSTLSSLAPAGTAPSAVWLTRGWPPGRSTTLHLTPAGEINALAITPTGPWNALLEGDALLVPPEIITAVPSRATTEVVLFTPHDDSSLAGWVAAMRAAFKAEGDGVPSIQDPVPLRDALAALEKGQRSWRTVVLGLLGTGVVLVFAAIGILEHREMRFAQALLRSLGVRARLLWFASFGENLLLANVALGAALVAVHLTTGAVLAQLPAFEGATAAHLPFSAAIFLAVIVNLGVLASLIPLARELRRPLGAELA